MTERVGAAVEDATFQTKGSTRGSLNARDERSIPNRQLSVFVQACTQMVDAMLSRGAENLSATIATGATSGPSDLSSQWMARFAQQMRDERRVRAGTLEAYTCDIAMLARWAVRERSSLLNLAGADLARYLRERFEQGTRASTLERQLSGWRRFYAFLVKQGALVASPVAAVRGLRVIRDEPRQVPDEVLGKLLQPVFGGDTSSVAAYRARRNHAIVWTLYATGLGVSDVRLLRWPQIDGKLLDARGLAVFKALRDFTRMAGPVQGASAWCFPTASGVPMSRQALCHVVRKWARDCGSAEVVTPSILRQSGRAQQTRRHHVTAPVDRAATIKLLLDHPVALAGLLFEARTIQDPDAAPAVMDQAELLQFSGRLRDTLAAHAEHVGNEFLRHHQLVGGQPVEAEQQPAAQLLVHGMMAIARRGLRHLRQQRLCVAQQQVLQRTGAEELFLEKPSRQAPGVARRSGRLPGSGWSRRP